jgi:Mlc titration factor MtfA (ptsG expression regulator)
MPILISASAIQLTLGLKKFGLSHFSVIQVYPREFVGLEPFRILMGNVTGNTINIAWTHFLQGYRNGFDSQNVGLHEMAHALYYQNFESEVQVDKEFRAAFPAFQQISKTIFEQNKVMMIALYSNQAVDNYQEFWAESIEVFFENPAKMMKVFPELYDALGKVLNQDPLNYPVNKVG